MVTHGGPKKGHRPPSRIRYERSHPVIGIRVDRTLYGRLRKLKQKSGRSFANLIKEALGAVESSVGHAYQEGYAEAESKLALTYPCAVCGKEIAIKRSSDSYKAMREYMREHRWGHSECYEKE